MTSDSSGGGIPCRPVGIVRNGRADASDRGWGTVVSRIELDPDRTPVLDIKPWMREFGPAGDVRQPAWCAEVMSGYFEE